MQDRDSLIAELEAAKREQNRCMGGVDPAGCVAASRRIIELRSALRDGPAMMAHLQEALTIPASIRGAGFGPRK